jgi:outer membrane protein with beta-barrel domain
MKSKFGFFTIPVCVISLIILAANPVSALPVGGDNEVQISGGASHTQGSDTGNFNADISYGYYLSPGWELGFRQAVNYNFVDDGPDAWQATTTPFLLYNFRITDVLVPYLGIQGGVVWNDRDVTGTFGPAAGLKLFVADQTFVNIGYRYEWFFNSFEAARDNRTHGNHVANIGLGYVWGGSGDRKTR